MLNTFDRYALQKAIEIKKAYGAQITCVTMGPPPAKEILVEALEHGADFGVLLTDKRLAASDTLATAYALYMTAVYLGGWDLIFTGLQTTDGDTAQVGPQMAERANVPQITYCEKMSIDNRTLKAYRVIEGGHQELEVQLPVLVTVANSATPLEPKRFAEVAMVKELLRNPVERDRLVSSVNLDDIKADPKRIGLVGSPTVVGKTWKLGEVGGSCVVFQGASPQREVDNLMKHLRTDKPEIGELIDV